MTDLAQFIQTAPLVDTHEHTFQEAVFVTDGPDVLMDLFHDYIEIDLAIAGASDAARDRLIDAHDPDIEGRWNGIKEAWEHCRWTSYGRAARLTARLVYGMDEITLPGIQAAAERNAEMRQPGGRLRLLREVANLDHVQIDDQKWACLPDPSGPDFFLNDISWNDLASGQVDALALGQETGVAIHDTASLRQAIDGLFDQYGAVAIAVKSAHAYARTLAYTPRTDAETEPILRKSLRGETLSEVERLCLGDWCLARGIERAIEYNLPFKIHTGLTAFLRTLIQPDRLRAGHLCPLLAAYPEARFVLMHTAYPYSAELLAVAKQFPNVYLDMCWGWAIDFHAAIDFVRRVLHAVPVNKWFAFGGDAFWPAQSVAYAFQARDGLTRALQAEIDDGLLHESEAIQIARRVMRDNQYAVFDINGRRATIQARLGKA